MIHAETKIKKFYASSFGQTTNQLRRNCGGREYIGVNETILLYPFPIAVYSHMRNEEEMIDLNAMKFQFELEIFFIIFFVTSFAYEWNHKCHNIV